VKRWCSYGLVIVFLILGVANVVRAGMAAYVAPVFQGDAGWPLSLPITVLGGIYLFWGVAFVVGAILVSLKRPLGGRRSDRLSVRWAVIIAIVYQGTLWALRLLAYRSPYAQSLWMRDGVLTGFFLATVAILGKCIKS
jgi:hypothetical protein